MHIELYMCDVSNGAPCHHNLAERLHTQLSGNCRSHTAAQWVHGWIDSTTTTAITTQMMSTRTTAESSRRRELLKYLFAVTSSVVPLCTCSFDSATCMHARRCQPLTQRSKGFSSDKCSQAWLRQSPRDTIDVQVSVQNRTNSAAGQRGSALSAPVPPHTLSQWLFGMYVQGFTTTRMMTIMMMMTVMMTQHINLEVQQRASQQPGMCVQPGIQSAAQYHQHSQQAQCMLVATDMNSAHLRVRFCSFLASTSCVTPCCTWFLALPTCREALARPHTLRTRPVQ